jgi:Ribonuclease HI
MAANRPPIYLYTDGAASGNPGPGGWGVVLRCGEVRKELSGGFACTTNNRMELLAVIKGLEAIRWEGAEVHVFSDSTYVVRTVTEGWKRKKNHDLWARFDALAPRFSLQFTWIKGHAGHPENERCDRLAVEAYSFPFLPPDEGYVATTQPDNLFSSHPHPSHSGLDPESHSPHSHSGPDPESHSPHSHSGLDPESHSSDSHSGLDPESNPQQICKTEKS